MPSYQFCHTRENVKMFENFKSLQNKLWKAVADSREWGQPPPMTGCVLKQVKILHQSALFLHKVFKKILESGYNPLSGPTFTFSSPLYCKFLHPPLVERVTDTFQTPYKSSPSLSHGIGPPDG